MHLVFEVKAFLYCCCFALASPSTVLKYLAEISHETLSQMFRIASEGLNGGSTCRLSVKIQ